jgi:hypothetical protein
VATRPGVEFSVFEREKITLAIGNRTRFTKNIKHGGQVGSNKWHLISDDASHTAIEKALSESETCAAFVGPQPF